VILSSIYQELFPTLFIMSKSLNVPSPPYRIGGSQMVESPQADSASASPEAAPAETQPSDLETQPSNPETPVANTEAQTAETQNDASENTTNDTAGQNPN
jgi:hypothetical protein